MIIKVDLSVGGINKAVREVEALSNDIKSKTDIFLKELANIGLQEASFRFTTALYDGLNDSSCSVVPIKNGYSIEANGQSVAFIEFGTGVVYYKPYPLEKPAGIVEVGHYGKGNANHGAWVYRGVAGSNGRYLSNIYPNKDSDLVLTKGNPPNMCMYYTSKEIEKNILEIAREVFTK